jgi:hypothetical protein
VSRLESSNKASFSNIVHRHGSEDVLFNGFESRFYPYESPKSEGFFEHNICINLIFNNKYIQFLQKMISWSDAIFIEILSGTGAGGNS